MRDYLIMDWFWNSMPNGSFILAFPALFALILFSANALAGPIREHPITICGWFVLSILPLFMLLVFPLACLIIAVFFFFLSKILSE